MGVSRFTFPEGCGRGTGLGEQSVGERGFRAADVDETTAHVVID